jgi:hypothetical protein
MPCRLSNTRLSFRDKFPLVLHDVQIEFTSDCGWNHHFKVDPPRPMSLTRPRLQMSDFSSTGSAIAAITCLDGLHRSLTSTAVEVTALLVCWIIVAKRPQTESGKAGFTGREDPNRFTAAKTVPARNPSVHRTTLAADACCL